MMTRLIAEDFAQLTPFDREPGSDLAVDADRKIVESHPEYHQNNKTHRVEKKSRHVWVVEEGELTWNPQYVPNVEHIEDYGDEREINQTIEHGVRHYHAGPELIDLIVIDHHI